jgi:hypothetical protein
VKREFGSARGQIRLVAMPSSRKELKNIWFEGEMLPNWAQLLDLAARMCPVSEGTRSWFSHFTNASGVDDARTITLQSEILLTAIRKDKETLLVELERTRADHQALQIIAAWEYSLETMIHESRSKKTCSWRIDGKEETNDGDYGDGDVTLRRV